MGDAANERVGRVGRIILIQIRIRIKYLPGGAEARDGRKVEAAEDGVGGVKVLQFATLLQRTI